jgi:hypothetical protein
VQLMAGVATHCCQYGTAARLLGYVKPRLSGQDYVVDVDPEWFLQPLREHFGEHALAELMVEGALWPEGRAIEEASKV